MRLLRSDSNLLITLGLIGIIAVRGLTSGLSASMIVVFFVLFGILKVLMGLKTWWHALLGGSIASILWIAFVGRMTGVALAVLPAILALIAAFSIVKIALGVRHSRRGVS
jgi:hypothetical protein